ncbi:MAG: alpha/beta hydrolase [Cyclobacteriaceae bacterium]|nr:alpha/beta hydrolase [Cyclobacteriaceae bacterium]
MSTNCKPLRFSSSCSFIGALINRIEIFLFIFSISLVEAQQIKVESVPNQPYLKYLLSTENDTITFYLSASSETKELPLIVYIQGSGMNSLFAKVNGRIVPTSGHMTWYDVARNKYRILIIEKPGVSYLQTGESDSFDKSFSLESWSDRIVRSIDFVTQNIRITKNKILVVGHSEGGLVASRVSKLMNGTISNVAIMGGEGPPQLYSMYKFAENGIFFNTEEYNLQTSQQRLKYLTDNLNLILAEPHSTQKKFWGFTYLRWSSMLRTSVIDELEKYDGKIFVIQGAKDTAVFPESAVIAYATLLSKGRNVIFKYIENADHSFNLIDNSDIDGWKQVIEEIIAWFDL